MRVELVFSPAARQVVQATMELPEGSTVGTALIQSGWREQFELDRRTDITFGIWNDKATLHTELRDGDRLEVYRALLVDPKVARRERFNKQGTKAAGLFSKRRAGAKAGY
jgi:putative ubiquitin-RnfH superfamily antitoxin RatB of RatAB toxin-antitoxin module